MLINPMAIKQYGGIVMTRVLHFFVALSVVVCSFLLFSHSASAAAKYPNRNITLIVPYPPGGNMDMSSRPLANALGEILGVKIIVQPTPGAAALTGTLKAMTSKPDGYTLYYGVQSIFTIRPNIQPSVRLSHNDMAQPIGGTGGPIYTIATHKDSPFNTLQDFVEACKKNPGQVTVAQIGRMGTPEVQNAQIKTLFGIDFKMIPYEGNAPVLAAVLGKHVDVANTDNYNPELKILAVMNPERGSYFPEHKTFVELGYPDVKIFTEYGVWVPKGTPPDIIKILEEAVKKAVDDPEYIELCKRIQILPKYKTKEELAAVVERDSNIVKDLISRGILEQIKD